MPRTTISIPKDLRARMDAVEGVNWSGIAQQAFEDLLNRIEANDALRDGQSNFELELLDDDGKEYFGTITGVELFVDGDNAIYSLEDGRLIHYDIQELNYRTIEDPESELLPVICDGKLYVATMHELGIKKPRLPI